MKNKLIVTLISVAGFCISSCANYVSKGTHPGSINNMPVVANLTITDKKGVEVYQGNHTESGKLSENPGFLLKDRYQLKFEKEGFNSKTVPVEFKPEGWYFGSILFSGDIGWLIVDPANGNMYRLDPVFFNDKLIISTASVEREEFKIFGINEIPSEWKNHLISLDNY